MNTNDHCLRNKSLRGRNKVAHVELLRELARPVPRDMLWLWSIETNNAKTKKIFCPPKKRAKLKTKKLTTIFGKSVFLIKWRRRYAIYMPPNTKDLAINQTMVAYGNRQNATAFARANNSDLLRSLKHLMETRLYESACIKTTHRKVLANHVLTNLNFLFRRLRLVKSKTSYNQPLY